MLQDWIQSHFLEIQIGFGVGALALGYWFFSPRGSQSGFRVRESDKRIAKNKSNLLAQARLKTRAQPILLEGISIEGEPHEILGVKRNASIEEINTAYRSLMKRFHPDRLGPPGSQPWNDAQRIAAAISVAKDKLLKR